jgi:hypothetical protein
VSDYRFDANRRPYHAERQPAFKVVHDELFRKGILSHPFGPAEQADMWPVFRWNGRDFEEIRPR